MNESAANPTTGATTPDRGRFAWAIGPLFVVVAAWLVLGSSMVQLPIEAGPKVTADQIIPGAPRKPMSEPPVVASGGYTHRCNECHRSIEPSTGGKRTLTQHTNIRFDHGMNDRCANCHDKADRERLVLEDGSLIGFNEVPRLCARCHGTLYRDWQRGTHGKTMGSWDASSGAQKRLTCNDCHDPHAPAYPPMQPLPGPRTFRMGDQPTDTAEHETGNPLRHWSMPRHTPAADPPASPPVPHQEPRP